NLTKKMSTQQMVLAAVLTAIVFVLQLVAVMVGHVGIFSLTLCLVPIVIGAATCGIGVGAWLGFVFGVAVLMSGDAAAFLAVNPIGTVITVLLKGTLCGLSAAAVYKLLADKNMYVAVIAAAIICPIVNTGVFLLGCLAFFMETIRGWAAAGGFGENVGSYMILGLVGVNFLLEMAVNVVLSPIIVRLLKIRKA
ncbi:MAG: ECF transporter S component, partial [Clostridia bacterium]|nr:ECF transporter S component [Clostridia bacterium]